MSPLPTQMRDRWASRVEPAAGQGTVYWHMLMGQYPEARAAAAAARSALNGFSGLHFTPESWLHSTLFAAGSTQDVGSSAQLADITADVQTAVCEIDPIALSVERILYHPEALMLAVEPVGPLRHLRDVVLRATGGTIHDLVVRPSSAWTPHITVAYSTASQDAAPIIGALGRSVPQQRFVLDEFSLVVQWGPERGWDWEQLGVVKLEGSTTV